jgi:hypothetical protein
MDVAVPERHKVPGVCYAVTDEGLELPVIDVTHPAFSHYPGPDEIDALARKTLGGFARSSHVPGVVYRMMARRSVVFRNVMAARGTFLPGVATYLQKLPPDTLGRTWAGRLDRRLLRLVGPVCMRLRLRDASALLADAVAAAAGAAPPLSPLHLVSIAGGTAIECLNALILLRRTNPGLLAGRPVTIHVLDPDAHAASFGRRALQELEAAGGPLEGLRATILHVPYDWRRPQDLRDRVARLACESPAIALSSEGGLFEYGSDDEIVANLLAAREAAPPGVAFVASTLRDNEVGRAMRDYGKIAVSLHERGDLDAVVARAGWTITRCCDDGPVYQVVSLAVDTSAPC